MLKVKKLYLVHCNLTCSHFFVELEEMALYLIERGADIFKQHSKSDASPLEGAVKKKLKQVLDFIYFRHHWPYLG